MSAMATSLILLALYVGGVYLAFRYLLKLMNDDWELHYGENAWWKKENDG